MAKQLIDEIAGLVGAYKNAVKSRNTEWVDRHRDALKELVRDRLPSGSGIDNGTAIDIEASTSQKIVLRMSFHHMNDAGMYSGWTEHKITVTPGFGHLNIAISGPDKNDLKSYLHDVFDTTLSQPA